MTPFLKWPGGKRWFLNKHADLLPQKFNRYIEPFLGGGSIFFHLRPDNALIGDINPEVITAYKGIKEDWKDLLRLLETHQQNHSDQYYYKIRAEEPNELLQPCRVGTCCSCPRGIIRMQSVGKTACPPYI